MDMITFVYPDQIQDMSVNTQLGLLSNSKSRLFLEGDLAKFVDIRGWR